jgi:hypothetical protein
MPCRLSDKLWIAAIEAAWNFPGYGAMRGVVEERRNGEKAKSRTNELQCSVGAARTLVITED